MNRKFFYLSALLLGGTLLGCNGGGANQLPTQKVTGKVTMNGSPVAGATVTFSPLGEEPAAFGRTEANGTFILTTYDAGDGAVAGQYAVLVSKSAPGASAGGPPAGHDPNNPEAFEGPSQHQARGGSGGGGGGSLLPEKYATAPTTPLSAEVTKGGENDFTFEL